MASQEEIAKLLISLEAEMGQLKAQFSQGEKSAKGFGSTMNKVGRKVRTNWLAITAVIGGTVFALKKIHDQYAQFQHKMLEVNTLIGKSGKDLKAYSNQVVALTRRVPQSAAELTAALYDIVSAGVAAGEALNVVGLSAQAATAGVTNTKTAAAAGMSILNAYGKETKELGNIYDQLFKTVKIGVTTFPQLSSAIGTVLPTAVAAGIEFKEVAASIAAMTKSGIATARATTFLRSGINALAAPTKDAREAMEKMGITWQGGWVKTLRTLVPILAKFGTGAEKLKALRSIIPDIRAGQAIIALTNNIDLLNDAMLEIDDSKGAMREAFAIMQESPINKIKQLGNAFTELAIGIGEKLNPAIMTFIQGLGAMLKIDPNVKFSDLMGTAKDLEGQLTNVSNLLTKLSDKRHKSLKAEEKRTRKVYELTKLRLHIEEKLAKVRAEMATIVPTVESFRAKMRETPTKVKKTPTGAFVDEGAGGEGKKGVSLAAALMSEMRSLSGQMQVAFAELEQIYADGLVSASGYYGGKRALIAGFAELEIDYLKQISEGTDDENKKRQIAAQIQAIQNRVAAKTIELNIEEAATLGELARKQDDVLAAIARRVAQGQTNQKDRNTAELNALREKHAEEIKLLEETEATKDQILEAHALQRQEIEQVQKDQRQENLDHWMGAVASIMGTITQIYTEAYNKELSLEKKRIDTILQNMRKEGASEKKIAAKKVELDQAGYAKAKELYEKQKKAQLAMAIINGAQAILKGYADYGPIVGSIFAVLTAVLTGIQIAKINQQTFPGFAGGGLITEGTGPKSDDVPIMASRREFVSPAASVDHYGENVYEAMRRRSIPRSLFSSVPSMGAYRPSGRGFAEGGMVTQQGAGGSLSAQQSVTIVNLLDQSSLDQFMETPEGEKAVVNVIGRRNYEVKQIILGETEEDEGGI